MPAPRAGHTLGICQSLTDCIGKGQKDRAWGGGDEPCRGCEVVREGSRNEGRGSGAFLVPAPNPSRLELHSSRGESRGPGAGGVRRGGMKVKVRDWETGPAAPQ